MIENECVGAEPKKLHPFFSGPKPRNVVQSVVRPVTPEPSCSPGSDKTLEPIDLTAARNNEEISISDDARRKRRKINVSTATQQPTDRGLHGERSSTTSMNTDTVDELSLDHSVAIGEEGVFRSSPIQTKEPARNQLDGDDTHMPLAQAPESAPDIKQVLPVVANTDATGQALKPKKLLKFNPKTGTIGSPPKPKLSTTDQEENTTKKRGRPRRDQKPRIMMVCIRYGIDKESEKNIGEKIEAIFSGVRHDPIASKPSPGVSLGMETTVAPPPQSTTPKKRAPPKRMTPKKITHPFFSSKAKCSSSTDIAETKDKPVSPAKRQIISTSTPCSPKQIRSLHTKFNVPQFGMKSGGLKIPGAQHPAWPWQGMVHIRGDDFGTRNLSEESSRCATVHSRKSKGLEISLSLEESVIKQATSGLGIDRITEELKSSSSDDFLTPSTLLRIPSRHFESGKKLQARAKPELRTLHLGRETKAHPAVLHAYDTLATSLSAFDRSTCENVSWAQKYEPSSASRVLQSGREAELLRDWLHTLKVQSVDTGMPDAGPPKPQSAPTKKRRRKKLDDFIVSSGEEDNELDELSEPETTWTPSGSQESTRRTVIRKRALKGSKDARLTNAVLLSGPHGCGKTATVHAIAKELDFEIFEISPGSRRNGKDVLEKIGDMTRNHLVRHKQDIPKNEEDTEDEVARDLKSGKQGIMTAFFNTETESKPKLFKKKTAKVPQSLVVDKPPKKSSGKTQKQSLILLEEVDILYEEDKHFWSTVISLMAQSKRPFIMTCNDENLVPIQTLNLHGIFRFSTAPKDPAVDLLILIAANEGHALKRNAVELLYDSKKHDLRASIAELNYWCQIGVGDPKGGFSWFYQRWPRGSDVDEFGHKIRVVSDNTYRTGMGWLGRDAVHCPSTCVTVEEEILRQSWENWALDAGDCETAEGLQDRTGETRIEPFSREGRLATIQALDAYYENLSASDMVSSGVYSSLNESALDPTLPNLPNRARDDFIIGLQLLDAPIVAAPTMTSLEISITLKSLNRRLVSSTDLAFMAGTYPLDEPKTTEKIRLSINDPPYTTPDLTRSDLSNAFDPIAIAENMPQSTNYLDPSVFDRTMRMITLDVAPYVRSIVAYDQRLQAERLLRSNLLSEGGKTKKRMRTTRAAYSALEGGTRSSTRRDRYFSADVNPHLVARTGGKGWDLLIPQAAETRMASPPDSAQYSSDGDAPLTLEQDT